jgi:hypothetical protein
MSKPPAVVPIEDKARIIARDPKTQRIIIGIGSERIAFEFLSRVIRLPPNTGDQPATVLPMKKKKRTQKRR